jgi:hypothetical protein
VGLNLNTGPDDVFERTGNNVFQWQQLETIGWKSASAFVSVGLRASIRLLLTWHIISGLSARR